MLYNAVREESEAPLRDVARQMRSLSRDFLVDLVETAVRKGEIRTELNRDLAVFCVDGCITLLDEFIEEKFGFSYEEVLERGESSLPVEETALAEIVDDFLDMLAKGLQRS